MNLLGFRRLSLVTILLTLCLITLGGFVRNTGSSLACPDWPLCYGQILPKMEGQIAIEHSHRLIASLVGLLCIIQLLWAIRLRSHVQGLIKPTLLSLSLVIIQGIFGGITVLLGINAAVSTAHLGLSQIFMASLLWTFIKSRHLAHPTKLFFPSKLLKLSQILMWSLFAQMLLGAILRHTNFGAICGTGTEAMIRCMDPVTGILAWWPQYWPSKIHMFHRYFAILFAFALIAFTIPIMRWAKQQINQQYGHRIRRLCMASHAIVVVQILFGLWSVASAIGVAAVTLHLFGAALLWITLVQLNFELRCLKM